MKEREEELHLENKEKPTYHKFLLDEYLIIFSKNFQRNNYLNIACYVCKYLHLCGIIGNDKIKRLINKFKKFLYRF